MSAKIIIGIIGDYDGRPSHLATEEALKHSAKRLELEMEYRCIYVKQIEAGRNTLCR